MIVLVLSSNDSAQAEIANLARLLLVDHNITSSDVSVDESARREIFLESEMFQETQFPTYQSVGYLYREHHLLPNCDDHVLVEIIHI